MVACVVVVAGVLVGVVGCLVIGAMLTQRFVYTPPFRGADGTVLAGSVAEFRRPVIGGCRQAVLARGRRRDNPVLLVLHAGPGMPEVGVFRNLNAGLEDHYVVVHWDQRGAGKSYSPLADRRRMTLEQLVEDTHELTQYLKRRFGKDRIVLMGHSWGAGLGAVVAARYPEDYLALVGIGQPVRPLDSDRLSYAHTLELARRTGNAKAVREHEQIAGYWRLRGGDYVAGMMVQKKWVKRFGGQLYGRSGMSAIFRSMMCREFTVFDWLPALLGSAFSLKTIAADAYRIDLFARVPRLGVPYVLIEGRHDINSFGSLVEEYFDAVEAPAKRAFWFEHSAHWPHVEEPERFREVLVDAVPRMFGDLGRP